MKLLLIVSAECIPQEVGSRDSDRSLTQTGEKGILESANFLNKLDITPKIVLTSPFKRTQKTGDLFAANFKTSPKVETVPGLMPGANAGELIKAITNRVTCDSEDWLAVVVHFADTNLILGEILGEKRKCEFPVTPGLMIGVEMKCNEGSLSGQILFTKYPGKF